MKKSSFFARAREPEITNMDETDVAVQGAEQPKHCLLPATTNAAFMSTENGFSRTGVPLTAGLVESAATIQAL